MPGLLNAHPQRHAQLRLDLVILLALIVRVALLPLVAACSSSRWPRCRDCSRCSRSCKRKHKGNPQKLKAETMALYKEHGVNPLAGCFPMLIQLPILFSLFYAINAQLAEFAQQGLLVDRHRRSRIAFPHIFATSLATLDMLAASRSTSSRCTSACATAPAVDRSAASADAEDHGVRFAGDDRVGRTHLGFGADLVLVFVQRFPMGQSMYLLRRYGLCGESARRPVAADGDAKNVNVARRCRRARTGS